ncbi:hypothetical protein L2E82_16434 [Cichorium intybus]|uniref:Uncharacterized protein n=1 Tax=Cichorium intybus TaxID=13427 RepID=A0ACB9F574_CICIN|nr:hypothetical protein L2E82_16434 [Cichorium intybus]
MTHRTRKIQLIRRTLVDSKGDTWELIATVTWIHRLVDESHSQMAWLSDCMEQVLQQFDAQPHPMKEQEPDYVPAARDPSGDLSNDCS